MRICSITIWYNPDKEVAKTFLKNLPLTDLSIIVDNSKEDNHKLIKSNSKKIIYLPNRNNLGIAKALNIGCELAEKKGFKWVLTMDDDSFFDKEEYKRYILEIKKILLKDKKAVSFSPNIDGRKKKGGIRVNRIISSGNILNLNVWKKVGGFREDFFIYEVDIEMCYKLLSRGYHLYKICSVKMNHNIFDTPLKIKIFSKVYRIRKDDSPASKYYLVRNGLQMNKEFLRLKKEYGDLFPLFPLKLLLKVILFENQKIKKIRYIIRGYIDYKKRSFGKCPLER